MGGIVGRLAIRLASDLPIDAIITIATPHQSPPANLEFGMERLYAKVNTPPVTGANDPVLISICGGVADTQIVSDSCALPDFVGRDHGFSVFSSGIPAVWTNVEHQAIVWCDQVRWRIARVLLDMVSSPTRERKLSVARQWLLGAAALDSIDSQKAVVRKPLPAVHPDMTLVVRLRDPTPTQAAKPPFSLLLCDATATCEKVPAVARLIPYPDDARLPFPLPGEGVRYDESAFVLEVKNLTRKGTMEVASTGDFDILAAGPHSDFQATPRTWTRKFCYYVRMLGQLTYASQKCLQPRILPT